MIQAERVRVFSGHDAPVYALEESVQSGHFFSAGGDKLVADWGLLSETEARGFVNARYTIYSLKLSPDKRQLLIGDSNGSMLVVDLQQGKQTRNLRVHTKSVFSIMIDENANRIFTTGADGFFAVWNFDDFSLVFSQKYCDEKIRSATLHKDLGEIALACGDGQIRILDAETFVLKNTFSAHEMSVNTVCYHPFKPWLISGGRDAMIRIWNANDKKLLHSIPAHNYAVYSIVFSPDCKFFASASRDKTIKIWDSEQADFLIRIDLEKCGGHIHSVNTLLWLKSDNLLLSAGDDRKIMAWKIMQS